MNILLTFSETLNDIMLENNINANTLANILGVKDSTVSRYIHGQRLPSIDSLVKIANHFNCTTDYLLGLEEDNFTTDFLPCPPFADRLKFLMNYFKFSSSKIYKNKGITKARFYDWKNGISVPKVDNVVKLAQIFHCSVDFVIGRSNA